MDGVVNVTDEQRQREELERDEQWLAGVCERSAEIDPSWIKRTVRIAVEEQWFAVHDANDVPAELSARTRRAVREALTDAPCGAGNRGRTRVIRAWTWVGGGLAAAATIGLAVVGSWNRTSKPRAEEVDLTFAAAFEEFQDDEELDLELSELRDAFSKLDQSVANGWGEDLWEEPVDETSDRAEDGV